MFRQPEKNIPCQVEKNPKLSIMSRFENMAEQMCHLNSIRVLWLETI